jgi:putative transcriptional regulator
MSKQGTSRGMGDPKGHRTRPVANDPNIDEEDATDWARVLAMTDEEAYRNALADEDSQPMTSEQLARMRRAPNPRVIRDNLRLTQEQFARAFQIPLGTLRDWEQGVHFPDTTAKTFLRVIEQDPVAVLRALRASIPGHGGEIGHYAGHGSVTTVTTPVRNIDVVIRLQGEAGAPATATADMNATWEPADRAA